MFFMIRNFKSQAAQDIFDGINSKQARKIPIELHSKVQRLFDQLNAATQVETLKIPPSNRLEKLKGDLKTYWSLRVNHQLRVIFEWKDSEAFNVDIVDYH
jgi:proteic killer suppression protein